MNESTSNPAAIHTATRITRPVRALCCGCGYLNTYGSTNNTGNGLHEAEFNGYRIARGEPLNLRSTEQWARCVITRKCANCKQRQPQAYLRDDGEYQDVLEERHRVHCIERSAPGQFCTYCVPGTLEMVAYWDRHRKDVWR